MANITAKKEVHRVLDDATDGFLVSISKTIETDKTLSRFRWYLSTKWLHKRLEGELLQYVRQRDSLMLVDSYIIFGDRIFVRELLRQKVLKQFHSGHPGINKIIDSK